MWEDSQDYHHHNLGRAFAEAKTRMIENFPDPPCNPLDPPWHCRWCRYNAIIWNLVGDPMVPLFNHMPRTLDVTVSPQMVEPNIAATLSITVEDDGGPVSDALLCLMKSDEDVYLTDYTNVNGECQFELPPLVNTGSIAVTVTKYNYRPYEETIQVDSMVPGDLDRDGDIDRDDINILLDHRNLDAEYCPACDMNDDGIITALDARKLVLLCTRPRCAVD
jgi:hypothetical protein